MALLAPYPILRQGHLADGFINICQLKVGHFGGEKLTMDVEGSSDMKHAYIVICIYIYIICIYICIYIYDTFW
jgi:hypothetical protein